MFGVRQLISSFSLIISLPASVVLSPSSSIWSMSFSSMVSRVFSSVLT